MKRYYCLNCDKEKSKKGKYCKPCGYKFRSRPSGLIYKIKNLSMSYAAIHNWISKHKKKPAICEFCGINGYLVWANKSYQYKRDLNDWFALCEKCHNNHDRKNGWGKATRIFGAENVTRRLKTL